MSSPAAPILVYGHDPRLLETRRLVLETLGEKVHAATDPATFEGLVQNLRPSVLVLCYTLRSEELEFIVSFIQALYPATKVLMLRADGAASSQADNIFNTFRGSAAFKSKVAEMVFDRPHLTRRAELRLDNLLFDRKTA